MAMSSRTPLDYAVADELGLTLGPQWVSVDDVVSMSAFGIAFVFVYRHLGMHFIDLVPVWRVSNGMRFKPTRFSVPTCVLDRLNHRRHKRWYFAEGVVLHPIHVGTTPQLFDRFLFTLDDAMQYHPTPLLGEACILRDTPLTLPNTLSSQWPDPAMAKRTKDWA